MCGSCKYNLSENIWAQTGEEYGCKNCRNYYEANKEEIDDRNNRLGILLAKNTGNWLRRIYYRIKYTGN